MKAAIFNSYGSPEVMKIRYVQQPSIKDDVRVLIRVRNASVNTFDYLCRKGFLPIRLEHGLTKPKNLILGIDVAGTVEAVGNNVTKFKVGDDVFGSCFGSHAEYVCPRQNVLTLMPKNISFEEAAAVPCAALTAMQALRDVAQVKEGQKVLIYGASGGVGHFAVQLAKYYGAEVTAVCSASNIQWVRGLGAHHVIDYTKQEFTDNGKKYDFILDAVGKRTYFSCMRSLTETGIYITEQPLRPKYHPFQLMVGPMIGRKKAKLHLTKPNDLDMEFLSQLIEDNKIRSVVEKCYPLEQIVEAHRHIENGRTKGKIVLGM
ncbi:NAD(P)-dependent alcohol dehydrogenase [Paenibacillus sp. ACRRX]|uniref:NAD(P)-dependent alcohol dehydrogenase n=1 Tax=unclassified Paenibacillus TaxID=185978 RepID=UPI001EF4F188|nr:MULTISPECIES: NAD(P)-dependent alcohol dehydrogenase [unclassified Paenibacillus]MCG7406555.1 NAD(P)-dependent alcohol dehydrogenase [Paenibacillus sp. ACRRX]MDK8179588.1 NAD(P)-dependent alcohol dehydrogenase [Paenibacillus sp. UMB4589-SE434]